MDSMTSLSSLSVWIDVGAVFCLEHGRSEVTGAADPRAYFVAREEQNVV